MNEAADLGGNLPFLILLWLWWVLLALIKTPPQRSAAKQPQPAGAEAAKTDAVLIDPVCRGKIRRIDPSFDERHFLQGASSAYEIILAAYAAGNLAPLRSLLADGVLAVFEHDIAERLDRREALDLTFIGVKDARIIDVDATEDGMAVSVRLTAEIVSATRSPDGTIVEGDPERVIETRDLWTFKPDPASAGRSWLVTATDSA